MSEEIPHKIIDHIRFEVLSPQMIRRISVVEVQTADTYDESGMPVTSGLMDGRLGTLEPRQRCQTCGNTAVRCPGHFGHIELATPVIHVEFAGVIYDLLRSTCRSCGHILLSSEAIEKYKRKIEYYKETL
ncbi:DNA-directed RNA polymerase subunit A', partial [Candidatus Bathyarchaeota archaeon]